MQTIQFKQNQYAAPSYANIAKQLDRKHKAEREQADAERIARELYEQEGGDSIEIALQVLLVANLWLIEQAETILSGIQHSDREDVRDRRGYMADVVTSDGRLRATLNAAISAVRKQDKRLCTFVSEAGDKYADSDFSVLCAESADEYKDIIKPLTDALQRYCLNRQTSRGKMATDPIMAADATSLYAFAELVMQMYDFLACKVFPVIDRMGGETERGCGYRTLNGRTIREAMLKVSAALPFNNIDPAEIVSGKDGSQLLRDICKVTFSTECLDRIFRARGAEQTKVVKRSMVDEWEHETMSLNYYHQHYNAAWREVEFKRKKKK